jgi:threonine/homoserine/homoserine lactone efflux protein
MSNIIPSWPLFSVFLFASFMLAITPGPGVLYIVTRSLVQGRGHGLASVFGVALGNFGNACAASVGLAAVFALSSVAFTVVKYAGAFYLMYLGIQMLRSSTDAGGTKALPDKSLWRAFSDGLVVALLNPKTAIFFAAFLPQFLNPDAPVVISSVALGAIFVAIAVVTDSAYALAASTVAPLFCPRELDHTARRIGGGIFIGLGLLTAFTGARGEK